MKDMARMSYKQSDEMSKGLKMIEMTHSIQLVAIIIKTIRKIDDDCTDSIHNLIIHNELLLNSLVGRTSVDSNYSIIRGQ